MPDDIVSRLFDEAYHVREQQEEITERRAAVRESLRNLRKSGVLSDEQADEVEELFPTIERKRKNNANETEGETE